MWSGNTYEWDFILLGYCAGKDQRKCKCLYGRALPIYSVSFSSESFLQTVCTIMLHKKAQIYFLKVLTCDWIIVSVVSCFKTSTNLFKRGAESLWLAEVLKTIAIVNRPITEKCLFNVVLSSFVQLGGSWWTQGLPPLSIWSCSHINSLLNFHFTSGPVKGPQELSLAESVVASDKSPRRHHPVAHLLEGVQHVITRSRELHLATLFVLVIGQRGRLLWQDSKLVQGKPIHCAAVDVTGNMLFFWLFPSLYKYERCQSRLFERDNFQLWAERVNEWTLCFENVQKFVWRGQSNHTRELI